MAKASGNPLPYSTNLNLSTKVLAFVQFGGPSRGTARRSGHFVARQGCTDRGDIRPFCRFATPSSLSVKGC